MTLSSGSRIGPYEIGSRIGVGGMGEVFRAVDINLGRPAAIKVLPASLAGDSDRLARFQREAQTLASLNHPNIAQVFSFEKGAGQFRALAMEFVEGPTLADRIAAGAIPIDEAVPIAVQIADGLESAHDHGIIHRDLKPQNIKVRPDGIVKVLDFGLAKAMNPVQDQSSGLMNSPTITSPATHAGVVLGTASYMSPEQAKGRAVDRRADIWAFGCVLFEMLTGARAFPGSDVSETFVAILRDEPAWEALPSDTPPHVRALLRRCLQKDVRKRLPHIAVARLELTDPPPAAAVAAPARSSVVWRAIALASLAVAIGVLSWAIWSRLAVAPAAAVRVRIELGNADPAVLAVTAALAMAPDGKTLAFAGRPMDAELRTSIYVRQLDRFDAQAMPGTEGGQYPFFSPDGRWVAFFAQDTLKKVPAGGGAVSTIGPAPSPRGGAWGDDDIIVFASLAGISRVPASGGTPELVAKTSLVPPSTPEVLPRGRGVLYGEATTADTATGSIFVRDFGGGTPKELVRGGRSPRYAASGHLTFVRGGALLAVPFDLETLEVKGEAVSVLEGVYQAPLSGFASLAMSSTGTLVYLPGGPSAARQTPVMWLTQSGSLTALRASPASFGFQRFSPDGKRLAMVIVNGRQTDIWVYDWERDILTRVTTDPGSELGPVWTPDGTGLVFAAQRGGSVSNLFWRRADGTGDEVQLTTSPVSQIPDQFDREGRLVYHAGDPSAGRQALMALPLERAGDRGFKAGTPVTLIGGPFLKANPRLSADGRWIAYAANDTGSWEIYVQRYPELGDRIRVSAGGGNLALWSPTKRELYYTGPAESRLMVVPYNMSGDVLTPGRPRPWSQATFSPTPPFSGFGPAFDLHPDGERLAVAPPMPLSPEASGRATQLGLVTNFFDELRRVAPVR